MRTAEDRWRLLDPDSFREHSHTIRKIREAAPGLAVKYGFNDQYPLAESLIEAFGKHMRDSKRLPMPEQRKALHKSLDAAHRTGSMEGAGLGTHILLSIYSKVPTTDGGETRRAISTAKRDYEKAHPKGNRGRHEDITNTVIRTLLHTYARGTGKTQLFIAHPTADRPTYRGRTLRFVCECLSLMGSCATEQKIADLADVARNRLMKKEN
ncbi:MAG: hypothetical protein ACOY5W_14445 [Pseudomonadota bacterium]